MSSTIKRPLEEEELFRSIQTTPTTYALRPPGDGGGEPRPDDLLGNGPLPSLFTWNPDFVDFADVKAGQYDPASYYDALRGNDTVVLPADQAAADAIGYDATRIFYGNAGNDFIVGGKLNDLVSGDSGNDRLFGNQGDDVLAGGTGNDQLFGSVGNDLLYAGTGIDYVEGGDGDDIIVSTEDDQHVNDALPYAPDPFGGIVSRDELHGGGGNDIIFATNEDHAYGGGGNDIIVLNAETDVLWFGVTEAGNGDDIVLGSKGDDFICTGTSSLLWPTDTWNPWNELIYGGYNDIVAAGDGDDFVQTMIYCNATVATGAGDDRATVLGLWDVISMGDGADRLLLFGGACEADLGAGNDEVRMARAAYDNPNVSEITLGAGYDAVKFVTNEWLTNGDQQPLEAAPWILDFNVEEDVISQIDVTNLEDASQSLDQANIKCIDIAGGSALVYDDPVDNSVDFCFARFADVSAQALQTHIEANTIFA